MRLLRPRLWLTLPVLALVACTLDTTGTGVASTETGSQAGNSQGTSGAGGAAAGASGSPQAGSGGATAGAGGAGQAGATAAGQGGATGKPCAADADCDDGSPCTQDVCVGSVCENKSYLNPSCSDGNACNGKEVCAVDGACQKGAPVSVDDGDACTDDVCDPATGIVQHKPRSVGDGDPCTVDACNPKTGEITHVSMVDDGNLCTKDSCDSNGNVVHAPINPSDADPCTKDSCDPTSGVKHETIVGCSGCTKDEDCDDGNPCHLHKCDTTTGACLPGNLAAGASCADTTVCNGQEACDGAGVCVAGTALVVDDKDKCTVDVCDPVTGVAHSPVNLDDGNDCTVDACDPATGVTHVPAVLDDGDVCTVDACATPGGVTHTAIPDCAGCTGAGDCPDRPCNLKSCVMKVCSYTPRPDGFSCTDNDQCNGDERCAAGACAPGTPLPTDDNDACTVDSCAPGIGVQHDPVSYDDKDPCTTDSCDAVTGPKHVPIPGCKPCTTPGDCDDANPCTIDGCAPGGACTHSPKPVGTPCANANKCDGEEQCTAAGDCAAGTPVSCAPAACNGGTIVTEACEPASGSCKKISTVCGSSLACQIMSGATCATTCQDNTTTSCASPSDQYCMSNKCLPKIKNGDSCGADIQCESGRCGNSTKKCY
ncbi:MAG: hypothetical protein IT374_26770 [Polyangiaceae bacterium]|nr:hypothetical protein [Polyangiaceae bacterium]